MTQSERPITKYQLPLFILLSYLLSWWSLPVLRGLIPHGPAIAAAIVIALALGRSGLREWWGRLTNFRAGWWFLIGPALVLAYEFVGFVLNILLGASVASPLRLPAAAAVFEILLLGGQWEEPGWSGYALPTLQKRFAKRSNGAFIATLIVGIIRGIWHLPLFLVGAIPWYDAFLYTILPFQAIISWIYNKSGGSIPAVMAFHLMSNLLFLIFGPAFAGADKPMYSILYMACGGLVGLAIAWRTRFNLGWRGTED